MMGKMKKNKKAKRPKQMYKVFFNERWILLSDGRSALPETHCQERFSYEKTSGLRAKILEFETSESESLHIWHPEFKKLKRDFLRCFKLRRAAGGRVWNERGQVLLIRRWDTWDFPKGHLHEDEKKRAGALREVAEECGIHPDKVLGKLPTTYHCYRLEGKLVLKKTYWFEMLAQGAPEPKPQAEEQISEAVWTDAEDLPARMAGGFASLRPLFELPRLAGE